ncbi:Cobalt-zinc-cadmium resistance protein CzcA; Cation efflux system protein CusA [hydrothermal vent metagenome]|uniref:Cobalt-zinc-cadmium resistance protein CzcA Cation efflux system protein CusA n=1 Tax=hydrothermal vent metagenome TaxID=652676 RepID=A0A3B0RSD7_9ZZZZ
MMWSNLFFRNRRLTVLIIGLIIVAGFSAIGSLPRQEDPSLTHRFDSANTPFPGASAERVEALVTEKIEAHLSEIDEIKRLKSTSRTGMSTVAIQLEDWVKKSEVDNVWSQVRDKLKDAQQDLPDGAGTPYILDRKSAVFTYMVGLTWQLPTEPQVDILGRFAKELERIISPLPGTEETDVFGELDEEFIVTIDPDALASVGLTVRDVSDAIARTDSKVPAGQFRGRQHDLVLEVGGELKSEDRIRNIPLKQTADGRFLRVRDVANVRKGYRNPPLSMALLNGQRGIIVGAKVNDTVRVDHWVAQLNSELEKFRKTLPDGIKAEVIFNQDVYSAQRLSTLVGNVFLGAGIIILIMVLMMGWRSAILVATALPLTVLIVMATFHLMDIPLHQMSITGLIIALGLLIDNAIVAVDEYRKCRRQGNDVPAAISKMVKHLFIPLLASTVTTSLTFMPIVLSPGATGEFIGTMGLAVIISLFASLFLSMTIIPALAGYFDRGELLEAKCGILQSGYSNLALKEKYRAVLRWCMDHPRKAVLISITLPLLGFGLSTTLVQQFFPPVDRDQFQIQMTLPPEASIGETARQVAKARAIMARYPEITSDYWVVAETPPAVFYNTFLNQAGLNSFAGGFINTISPEATLAILPRLQRDLMTGLPNAMILAIPFEQGPPFEAPVEIFLYGQDLKILSAKGEEIRAILTRTKNITYTSAKISLSQPKLTFIPDEDAAEAAGLKLNQIAEQLNNALEGRTGGSVLEGNENLPVRVQVGGRDRSNLDYLFNNSLVAAGGSLATGGQHMSGVPLSSLGTLKLVPTYNTVTRRDSQRLNILQAFTVPFSLPSVALTDFQRRLKEANFQLPEGYHMEFGGETEKRSESQGKLFSTVLPLLVIMMGILVLAFNSFTSALIIGGVAFFSMGLAFFAIWLFGFPMGFTGIMGTMGLIGLAINDSIVVLAALRANEEARAANPDVIVDIVVGASRHIISTTLTTIGGFMPLIIWGGGMWPPLATAISGGMVGATLLALIFVPTLYYLRVRRRARRAALNSLRPLKIAV